MISLTRLLGGASFFGEGLAYASRGGEQQRAGLGPVVVWNATRSCNLDCVHCHTDAERSRFLGELSTAEARAMIDDLARFRVPALVVSGGEPLMRADMLELAEYATMRGIAVSLCTNGTLVDEATARRMAAIGVSHVGVSIDGSEADHDRFRARPGSFADALRGLRHCRDAGIRVGIRFTVTSENADSLEDVFALAAEEDVPRLCIHHLVYSHQGSVLAALDLLPHERRALMERVIDQVEAWIEEGRDIEVVTEDNECDAPFAHLVLSERDAVRAAEVLERVTARAGNLSGSGLAAIDSFGVVHPDQFTLDRALGSIRERRFSDIWSDGQNAVLDTLRRRRELLKGRCAACRWLGHCNGNSRARAEAATGDYWQPDPACYLRDDEIAMPLLV